LPLLKALASSNLASSALPTYAIASVWLSACDLASVRAFEYSLLEVPDSGSGRLSGGALRRGECGRSAASDQRKHPSSGHPSQHALCCGLGRRGFESLTGLARARRPVQQRDTATCARYGWPRPTSTYAVGCTVPPRPGLCRWFASRRPMLRGPDADRPPALLLILAAEHTANLRTPGP
jgi:hypothetical protein